MALLTLSESRWRMIRRVVRRKRFRFDDCRNGARHDPAHFGWLVAEGFFVEVGEDEYEVTQKGRDAADLGEYEWEPPPKPR